MTLLFSGRPDDGSLVLFGNFLAENKIAAGSTVPVNLTFVRDNIKKSYGYYTMHVVNEDNVYLTNENTCNRIPDTNKTLYNLDAKDYKVGDRVKVLVTLYANYRCNRNNVHLPITDTSINYTIVENVTPQVDLVVELIDIVDGDEQYCNIERNGNYKIAQTDNLFVKIAYSQVGYKEKGNTKNIDSCKENAGKSKYQKYTGTSVA